MSAGIVVNVCDEHDATQTVFAPPSRRFVVKSSRARVRPGRCNAETDGVACRALATRTQRIIYTEDQDR